MSKTHLRRFNSMFEWEETRFISKFWSKNFHALWIRIRIPDTDLDPDPDPGKPNECGSTRLALSAEFSLHERDLLKRTSQRTPPLFLTNKRVLLFLNCVRSLACHFHQVSVFTVFDGTRARRQCNDRKDRSTNTVTVRLLFQPGTVARIRNFIGRTFQRCLSTFGRFFIRSVPRDYL